MQGPRRHKPPRGRGGERRPGPGRRTPPPEITGLEGRYLKALQTASAPLRLQLRGGATVRGAIEYFDRDLIKISTDEGPGLLLRKSDIRTLAEE